MTGTEGNSRNNAIFFKIVISIWGGYYCCPGRQMCWDRKGRIYNILNIFLRQSLFLVEVTILNTFIFYSLVAGSIPDGVIGIFQSHNPSGRAMALGSTQPLTKMSISWG